jgi:hypothetical protein
MWSTAPFSFQYVIYLSQPLIPQVTYLLQPPRGQGHSSWDVPFDRIRSPVHMCTNSSMVGSSKPWAMHSHAKFVKTVICSEEMAVQYLCKHNLLDNPEQAVINWVKCGSVMQNKRRLIRGDSVPVLRCPRKGCQVMRSVFMGIVSSITRISITRLCQILDVVYFFLCETPIKYAETITGRSHSTLVDWYNMCQEVCTSHWKERSNTGYRWRTNTDRRSICREI